MNKNRERIKRITICGLFCAFICVVAPFSLQTSTVPFTLGFLCIFICASLLPLSYSLPAILGYLVIGAVGLPVFASFKSGIGVIVGPTGGFLLSYPIMAIVIYYIKKIKPNNFVVHSIALIMSMAVSYLIGTVYFSVVMDSTIKYAFTACVVPYVWFDGLKAVLTIAVTPLLKRGVGNFFD